MDRKIKSITLYKNDLISLSHPGGSFSEKGYKYSYTEMDHRNNVTVEIKYDPSGKIEEKYIFHYDNNGNLIEEISFLSDHEVAEHKTFEFNENSQVIREYKHYADNTKDKAEYVYDTQGNLIEKTTFDPDNEPESRETLEWKDNRLGRKQVYEFGEMVLEEVNDYDEAGNLTVNKKWTTEEGITRVEYYYDEKKQVIKTLTYNKDEKLINKTLYNYNDNGKLIQADFESARNKNTTSIVYDDRGNAIGQTETNELGQVNNRAIRKFNEQGEVTETSVIIDFHGNGINQEYVLSYEYEYF